MIAKLILQTLLYIAGMGALLEGLPGYADYAARVRYRLLPGIW